MGFWNEFKTFSMRGNVIDLAVAVVIGNAFTKIVSSLVDGIIMPCLGLILGGINIADKTFMLGHSIIKWGIFLQSVIDFSLISFSIFLAIKGIGFLYKTELQPQAKLNPQEKLLSEIKEILSDIHESQVLLHTPSMAYN
jgi:large conductance mechanosensitive channel